MKKRIIKSLSVFLALIMLLGVMPAGVHAGGDVSSIREAKVFVHYPMGGQVPNMEGLAVGSADYTIDFVHFFDCYAGEPVGAFLEDVNFIAGRLYACQVHLVPKKEDYEFTDSSEVFINGRYPDSVQLDNDGSAYYTVFFRAAAGTVTVTFDTCGHGTPHAPVKVPKDGTLADAIPDVSELIPPDENYEKFVMWALDPLAVPYSYNAFSCSSDPVSESMTLYAH